MKRGIVLFLGEEDVDEVAAHVRFLKNPKCAMMADIIVYKDEIVKNRYGACGKIFKSKGEIDNEQIVDLNKMVNIISSDGVVIERSL